MFRIRIRPLWNGGSCFECHSKSQWHVAEWQESLCRKIRTPQGTWSRTWWKSSQIHQCLHQEHQWWVRRNQTYRFVWKIWKNQLRQGNYTTWLNRDVETDEFSVSQNLLEINYGRKILHFLHCVASMYVLTIKCAHSALESFWFNALQSPLSLKVQTWR